MPAIEKTPAPNVMSAGDASSKCAAIRLPLSTIFARGAVERRAADRDGAPTLRPERAGAERRPVGIAFDHFDLGHRHAKPG